MLVQLRRLLPYLHRYRVSYAIGTACVLGTVALRFLIPYLLGDSIDLLRTAADAATPDQQQLRPLILTAALEMVAAAALGAAIRTSSRLMVLGNSRRAAHDVRTDVFARLLMLAPSFYVRHRTGDIMSRTVNDMQNVQGLLGPVFLYLIETGVLFAVGLAFMLHAQPLLTVIGLLPFPIFLWLAVRLARRVQEGSRAAQEKLGAVSAKVDESLSGHRVIKSLVLEPVDAARFAELCGSYSSTVLDVARTRAALAALMTFLAALSTFLVLAAGAPMVHAGDVTVGEMVSMVLYLGLLATPTRTLGFVLSSLQRGAAALGRIGELLDMPASIDDAGARAGAAVGGGDLEVRDLTIRLGGGEQPHLSGGTPPAGIDGQRTVLDHVSFSVPAGTTLGVVGPVGAGKTTLLRALSRQLEIEPGHVFVDGTDITEIPLRTLRRAFGMAPQDAFLFGDTLANNVRFGEPEADRTRVADAIETAQLDQDLDQLPDGVDTMLGERGVNLSGGQRQRTSLARVALLRPTVLLLDDTLSAIDTHTADAILARLRPLMAQRTTVMVAHRISTVQHADHILVLEQGRITERGTHDELLARGGYYASIYRRQSTREGLVRELGLEETP